MQTFQQKKYYLELCPGSSFFAEIFLLLEKIKQMYFGILVIIIHRLARKVLGNRTLEDLVCSCLSFVVQKDYEDIVKIQSLLIRDTSFTRNIFKSNTKKTAKQTKTNKNITSGRKSFREFGAKSRSYRGFEWGPRNCSTRWESLPPKKHRSFQRIGCIGWRDFTEAFGWMCFFFSEGRGFIGVECRMPSY